MPDETCFRCGKPVPDTDVEYRPVSMIKRLNPDGTEQLGNPLEIGFAPLCPECVDEHDQSA